MDFLTDTIYTAESPTAPPLTFVDNNYHAQKKYQLREGVLKLLFLAGILSTRLRELRLPLTDVQDAADLSLQKGAEIEQFIGAKTRMAL